MPGLDPSVGPRRTDHSGHTMMRSKPLIFISHIHEDAEIAYCLKAFLDDSFLEFFDVFVSSDGASIRVGENWSAAIETALKRSELVLVLVSPGALERRWIYFEAGGAYFAGKRVIPICCRDARISQVGAPLNWLQAITGSETNSAQRLIDEIASFFEVKAPNANCSRLAGFLAGGPCTGLVSSQRGVEASVPQRPLPIFVLVDSSGSMAGERIELVSDALRRFIDYLDSIESPNVAPLVSLIAFGDAARVVVPLSPIDEIKQLPTIQACGSRNLGEALHLLAKLVADDRNISKRSLHPVIIVISDGYPTDDWQSGLAALNNTPAGSKATKLCLAFTHDADYTVLRAIGTQGVLPMAKENDLTAVGNFFRWVSGSVSGIARAEDSEEESVSLPPLPQGLDDVW